MEGGQVGEIQLWKSKYHVKLSTGEPFLSLGHFPQDYPYLIYL